MQMKNFEAIGKLMYGQRNDIKAYQNIDFLCFRQVVRFQSWSAINFFFFFCPQTARVGRPMIFFFAQRLKKTYSYIKFDGSVVKPEIKLLFLCLRG